MFLAWNAVVLQVFFKEKQINEDGANPPAANTHQKNDKLELDSKLDYVNQITNNDIETNGLGGGNGGSPSFSWIVK
ncbi:hypothetical protein Patl1_00862 [Pistacia atlantica]|uniref:Uncharacterized protein n=1 Tax=Pistacia atlantica TaxID=434234 RepID=A0ACC1CCL3_9ROSI|nr:hypothetical protein Patl1_00862 [Pistacia atlantica]